MTMLPVSMDPAVSADGTTLLTQETEARYTVPASFRRSKVLLMMMATGYMGLAESSMGSMMANGTPDEVWWLALGVLFAPLVYLMFTLLAVTAANSNLDSIAAARKLGLVDKTFNRHSVEFVEFLPSKKDQKLKCQFNKTEYDDKKFSDFRQRTKQSLGARQWQEGRWVRGGTHVSVCALDCLP